MTIGDLIKKKNYDYIEYRIATPEHYNWDEDSFFAGQLASANGKIVSLDGDIYYESEEVISYKEWSNKKFQNGLTIVVAFK